MYYIVVKTSFPAQHRYVDAPENVKFLRDYHRHMFGVEVMLSVDHSNRNQEFFTVQEKLNKYIDETYKDRKFDASCEQIAKEIFDFLAEEELNPKQVEISEDGENSGGYYI